MSRTINAAILDLRTAVSSLKTSVVMCIVAFAIGAATKLPEFTLGLAMVFGVFASGMVFSVHEKSHSERLYGILPLKKSEIVAGRYLYALAIGLVNTAIAVVLTLLAALVRKVSLDPVLFLGVLSLSFLYYCFAVGVAYPIYFRFSFSRAYVFTTLPLYLVFLAALLLSRKFNIAGNLGGFLQFFSAHQALMPIFGLLIGLILLAVSALIGNSIYARKEI